MYTNNDISTEFPVAEKRGRPMENRIFGLRISLCLMLALLPSMAALADTEITDATYRAAGGDIEISLTTAGDTPSVSVFATENPARIVLDMADTDSSPLLVCGVDEVSR